MDKDELRVELVEDLADAVAVGAALLTPLGPLGPLAAVAVMAAGKVPRLLYRAVKSREDSWWQRFFDECRDRGMRIDDVRARVSQQVETDPKVADMLIGHMRDVLDAAAHQSIPILAAIRAAYYCDEREPDEFFLGAVNLLMQCTAPDLDAVRAFVGRMACIRPRAKSQTLLATVHTDYNTKKPIEIVADLEFDVPGAHETWSTDFRWEASALWKRLHHLLVSAGLAWSEGQRNSVYVQHKDMQRLLQFMKFDISEGEYRYRCRVKDKTHFAELVEHPACFGYGATPEEAFETLKHNLRLFAMESATAKLVEAA